MGESRFTVRKNIRWIFSILNCDQPPQPVFTAFTFCPREGRRYNDKIYNILMGLPLRILFR